MTSKLFKAMDRALSEFEEWALFLSVSLALVVAMANVLLRKFTPYSLYWSDEVVRKVIFFSTYIGCSAAIRNRSLIRIDALPQLLPVLRKLLVFINHLAVLFFACIMLYLGTELTRSVYHDPTALTTTLQIPEWIFYAVLPLMGGMMVLRTLLVIAEDLRGKKSEEA